MATCVTHDYGQWERSTYVAAFFRVCTICGTRQERKAAHHHDWEISEGGMKRTCEVCGEIQWSGGTVGMSEVDPLGALSKPTMGGGGVETLRDHGGITDYDPRTQEVRLADGSHVTVEALLAANPSMARYGLTELLERMAMRNIAIEREKRSGYTASRLTAMISSAARAAASLEEMNEGLVKIAEAAKRIGIAPGLIKLEDDGGVRMVSETPRPLPPKPFTAEDALKLILKTIRNADDPFAEAGAWLTRFTNEVTTITREMDDDS